MRTFFGIILLLAAIVSAVIGMFFTMDFGSGGVDWTQLIFILTPEIIAVILFVFSIKLFVKKEHQQLQTNPSNQNHPTGRLRSVGIALIVIAIILGVVYYVLPLLSPALYIIIRSNRIVATLTTSIFTPFIFILGLIFVIVG